tara:strand:+ start:73 stop:657 length:585 start_codon:yes stop_codon:yes gene_type:complete
VINNCVKKILFLFIIYTKLYSDPYQNFLGFLKNINGTKVDIVFQQVQYGKHYSTKGDLYIFSEHFYCYDDFEKRIIVTNDSIISINKLNRQVIYDDRIANDFSIFDIITGSNLNIKIDSTKNKNDVSIISITIPDLSLKGTLYTDSFSGKPINIILGNDSIDQFNVKIGEVIDIKKESFSNIDLKNYEVIDLRE